MTRTRAQAPPIDSEAFLRVRAASFVDPLAVMNGLRYLRPELTRRLAALDATEAELGRRIPPVYELLERDLARSVLKTYLAWLGRTEKALARGMNGCLSRMGCETHEWAAKLTSPSVRRMTCATRSSRNRSGGSCRDERN